MMNSKQLNSWAGELEELQAWLNAREHCIRAPGQISLSAVVLFLRKSAHTAQPDARSIDCEHMTHDD